MKHKTVFVISEFNPFHAGHRHLIDTLRADFDNIVCVMSGNTVQRGEPACAEKHLRARIAVENGVDLVLELPFPFCSMSASDFAAAGVHIAASVGCEYLAFGVEAEGELIVKAAEALADREKIERIIGETPSLSYPKAAEKAVSESVGDPSFMRLPNNILAVEYLVAIKRQGLSIAPVFIRRDNRFMSSSRVRALLAAGGNEREKALAELPKPTAELLTEADMWDTHALDNALLASLRLKGGSCDCYGTDSGSYARIYSASLASNDISALCTSAASASLTHARIRRTAFFSFFGIGSDWRGALPRYTSVLAANKAGCAYLAENKGAFRLPVITKPAGYRFADREAAACFEKSLAVDRAVSVCSQSGDCEPLRITPYIKAD